tara:strand:+ start:329 stop:547 length:219 start_codon:yes stop_codon:yes gene_type:complete
MDKKLEPQRLRACPFCKKKKTTIESVQMPGWSSAEESAGILEKWKARCEGCGASTGLYAQRKNAIRRWQSRQ